MMSEVKITSHSHKNLDVAGDWVVLPTSSHIYYQWFCPACAWDFAASKWLIDFTEKPEVWLAHYKTISQNAKLYSDTICYICGRNP